MVASTNPSPASLQSVTVDLYIGADELLRYYRGETGLVRCRARDGRRVQFPAALLRPYVDRDGVRGSFRILFTSAGKFQRIERIAP